MYQKYWLRVNLFNEGETSAFEKLSFLQLNTNSRKYWIAIQFYKAKKITFEILGLN